MVMRFLDQNKLDTTTLITVDAVNTATIENLFDRDIKKQWESVGYDTGTDTTIVVSFSVAMVIDKIFIQNHNLANFNIFYNGTTTNQFTSRVGDSSSTEDHHYFTFNTQTVSSITLDCQANQTTSTEYKIGQLYIGSTLLDFERNPTAADYKPIITRKQVVHKMPNGGVTQFIVDDKFKGQIKWKFLTNSFTTQLQDIYDTGTAFYFVPFATSTSWEGRAYEVAWTNNFDFRHSSNNKDAGQGGKIIIEETA